MVSSIAFAPNPVNERLDPGLPDGNRRRREASDSWPAYPETRRALLQHIVAEQINVVFLGGAGRGRRRAAQGAKRASSPA